jgi:hypothetical protein
MGILPDLSATLPTEDTIYRVVRELDAADAKRATASGEYRNARKVAKGDKINLEALDFVRKKLGKYTRPELIALGNHIITYAKALRVPVFSGLPLFAALEETEDDIHRAAYERGVVAGKSGIEDNPWSEGTPLYMAYERGKDDAARGTTDAPPRGQPDLRVVADALDADDEGVM